MTFEKHKSKNDLTWCSGDKRAIHADACDMPKQLGSERNCLITCLLTVGHGRDYVPMQHPIFGVHLDQSVETTAVRTLTAGDEQDVPASVGFSGQRSSDLIASHYHAGLLGIIDRSGHRNGMPDFGESPGITLDANNLNRPALAVLINAHLCDVGVLVNEKDLGLELPDHTEHPLLFVPAYQRSTVCPSLATIKPPHGRRTRLRPDTEHKDCSHG